MENIIHIFQDDVKGLCRNFLALVVALGLCVIPSLYAWFNIYSNWDPYANTGNVSIAVASEDAGYTKDDGTVVNMGDEVIETLHDNDKLGWTFPATVQDAIDGVYSGEYYAALVIEEDFSQSMYDCLANGMEHPKILYYENEKKNAIAVKITDSGSSTLQSTINEEFINVVVTAVAENLGALAGDDDSVMGQIMDQLVTVNDNLTSYNTLLTSFMECNVSLSETVLGMDDVLTKLQSTVNSINSTAATAKSEATQAAAVASEGLNVAASVTNVGIGTKLNTMAVAITAANNAINAAQTSTANGEDGATIASDLSTAATNLGTIATTASEISSDLENLEGYGYDTEIASLQKRLNTLSTAASATQTVVSKASETATKIEPVTSAISEATREIVSASIDQAVAQLPSFNQQIYADISSKISEIAASAGQEITSDVSSLPSSVATVDSEGMSGVLEGISNALLAGNEALSSSKTILNNSTEKLSGIISSLQGLSETEQYAQLLEALENDPSLYGEFLSQPVTVTTQAVYETSNYGSAVTPFYTTLALWVGGIVLVSLIKVKAKPQGSYAHARNYELFFGRYLLFFVLGQIQSVICVFGDLKFLEVQCVDVPKFYLIGAVTSFTFTLLIYTLTVSFGDIGKALVVVLVVIQIAGSSGTYPIELLPDIFQAIYQYFPFPYAINAMRETISGAYENSYWVYMAELLVFAAASVIVGVFIRKPFMKVNHYIEQRMEDTGMM